MATVEEIRAKIRARNEQAGLPSSRAVSTPSKAASLTAGALDTATLGAAPRIAGGQRAVYEATGGIPVLSDLAALIGGTTVGGVDAVTNLLGSAAGKAALSFLPGMGLISNLKDMTIGQDALDKGTAEATKISDEAMAAHPGYALTGQILGSILPGGGIAKGGKAATTALAKGGPRAKAAADVLANSILGRATVAGAGGAAEGGVYAANKGESIGKGALWGFGGGAGGQLIFGEALPAIVRSVIGGGRSTTTARANIGKEIKQTMRGAPDPTTGLPSEEGFIPKRAMMDRARELGDRSVMPDVNPGVEDVVAGNLQHELTNPSMYPVRNLMEERLGKVIPGRPVGQSVYNDFEAEVNALLPDTFNRTAGQITTGARASDIIADNAKEFKRTLNPEFEAVLTNPAAKTYKAPLLSKAVTDAFTGADDLTEALATAKDTALEKLGNLASQNKANMRIVNGKRVLKPEAEWLITPKEMHAYRTELDDMLGKAFKADSPNYRAISMLTEARNAVSNRLDQVPGFRTVNAKYAGEASYERAAELGQEILKPSGMSPEKLKAYLDAANPGDTAGFLEGMSRTIIDMMEKAGGEGATARKISRDDIIGKKLLTALGPQTGDKIIEAANRAVDLSQTAGSLVSGSQTAGRLRAKSALDRKFNPIDPWVLAGGIWQMIKPGQGASKAAALGAAGRMIPKGTDEVAARELARIASEQGPEAIGRNLDLIQQATDVFTMPKSVGGLDYTMAIRNKPNTNIMERAMAADVGQAPAFTAGVAVPAINEFNTPEAIKRRRRIAKRKGRYETR